MEALLTIPLTREDQRIYGLWNMLRYIEYGVRGGLIAHYTWADRRDANAMLVMVESGYSKVVQASNGDWAWYRHPQPRVPAE